MEDVERPVPVIATEASKALLCTDLGGKPDGRPLHAKHAVDRRMPGCYDPACDVGGGPGENLSWALFMEFDVVRCEVYLYHGSLTPPYLLKVVRTGTRTRVFLGTTTIAIGEISIAATKG